MITGLGLIHRWLRKALFCALVLVALPLAAENFDPGFEQANKFYEEGKYSEAVAAYDQLLQTGGVSEAVYFNRGNAFFKLGQLGRAIASYRLAERLAPRDPDLRANLQFARSQARGGSVYQTDRWLRLTHALTVNEWSWLTAATIWLVFGCLALAQWRPDFVRRCRGLLVATAMVGVFLAICVGSLFESDYLNAAAVVITGEADIRAGPLDESPIAYKVRDGVELSVLDRKDVWLQVVDPAQRVGWVRENQVLVFDSAKAPRKS